MIERLRAWAKRLKRDVMVLWLAARDPRVPLVAKLLAGVVAAYALSPIDLIPDFIPVLGYLDDLLIVPAGIWLAVRMIPAAVLEDLRAKAVDHARQGAMLGLAMVLLIWLAAIALVLHIAPPAFTSRP